MSKIPTAEEIRLKLNIFSRYYNQYLVRIICLNNTIIRDINKIPKSKEYPLNVTKFNIASFEEFLEFERQYDEITNTHVNIKQLWKKNLIKTKILLS